MTKVRLVVIICFVFAFAAGLAVGLIVQRPGKAAHDRSWLSRELDLTPAQHEQMQKIWSEAMSLSRRQRGERRDALVQERDEAIRALLAEDQRAKYDQLQRDYDAKLAALAEERRTQFQAATEQTRQILTEPQRQKYDELLKRQAESRHSRSQDGGVRGMSSQAAPHGGE